MLRVHVHAEPLRLHGDAVLEQDRVRVAPPVVDVVRGLGESAAAVAEHLLEALVLGAHGVVVAEVPLAEEPGRVASVAKDLCDRDLRRGHHRAAAVGVDRAGPHAVAARHERGPRGGAHRAHVEALHGGALRGEGVEARRVQDRVPVGAEIAVALVVREDHEDVRVRVRRALRA